MTDFKSFNAATFAAEVQAKVLLQQGELPKLELRYWFDGKQQVLILIKHNYL